MKAPEVPGALLVAQVLKNETLNLNHLTPAAERLVADFLLDRWDTDWRNAPEAPFAVLGALLSFTSIPREELDELSRWYTIAAHPDEAWPPVNLPSNIVDATAGARAGDIRFMPHQTNSFLVTAGFNLIADADAGTGKLLLLLNDMWLGPFGPKTTLGNFLDAYVAATHED
jgi:hypothetical protein